MAHPKKKRLTDSSDPEDRNWLSVPNSLIHHDKDNRAEKVSYWTDKNGKARLYTKTQLATCNILTNLNLLLLRSLVLVDTVNEMDENAKISNLKQQDSDSIEATESSAFNHFINLMAATPEVTFGEFLNFLSVNNDSETIFKMGKKTLTEVIKGKHPKITTFYSSNRIKKK